MLPHMNYWRSPKGLIPKMADWLFGRLWPEKTRSCITQPPVLAEAIRMVYQKTQNISFLRRVITPVQNYFEWLHQERNEKISGDGLITVIHPWETGMDLLPIWDHIHKIKRFFTLRTALWLSKIIKEYNKIKWDIEKIQELNLFLVKDVAFNSIYILNLYALSDLCNILGDNSQSEIYHSRAKIAQKALEKKCWDPETEFFYSITSLEDNFLPELTISGLFPICLEIPSQKLHNLINKYLMNEDQFWLPFPIPCVAKSSPHFNPKGSSLILWRGPVWVNCNWYLAKGLQKHGFTDLSNIIIQKTCELIERSGFREQYNPFTGKGYGAHNFGWSTLIVDLLEKSH